MSLYYVSKYLYELNRSTSWQSDYLADARGAVQGFVDDGADLTDEEMAALVDPDIGLLFHLGVNGQILMHFGALHQIAWQDHLQLMRDGIETYGPVREGVYAMTGYEGTDAHAEKLGQSAGNTTTERAAGERATSGGTTTESAAGGRTTSGDTTESAASERATGGGAATASATATASGPATAEENT